MDETLWQGGSDVAAMLDHVEGGASGRKLRLFACACVRRYWALFRYRTPRDAVEMAERLAEGQAGGAELEEMRQNAEMSAGNAPHFEQLAYQAAAATLAEDPMEAARTAAENCRQQAVREAAAEVIPGENEAAVNAAASHRTCFEQAGLLREVLGNPFRPSVIDPGWLRVGGGAAGAIARLIAQEDRFAELPYLADALVDAGCSDDALLGHLRQPGGHVRGCWALDLLIAAG
jgi:hypothetical protein